MTEPQLFIGVFLLVAAVCALVVAKSGPATGPDDDPDNGVIEPGSWIVVHWVNPRTKWVSHFGAKWEASQFAVGLERAGRQYEIHGPDDDDDDFGYVAGSPDDDDDDVDEPTPLVVSDDPEADLPTYDHGKAELDGSTC